MRKVTSFQKKPEKEPEFVLEDLETGARESADELAKALFGPKATMEDVVLKEIDPKG